MSKVSGPILDRIDLCVELHSVDITGLQGSERTEEDSATIRARVIKARETQEDRFRGSRYRFNADVEAADIEKFCPLGTKEKKCMERLFRSLQLGARAYHRIWKVGRTIADLAGEEEIREEHLLEAVCYRPTQEYWQVRGRQDVYK